MSKGINKVVKIMIHSDFLLNSGWQLLDPIFAIFVVQNIVAGDVVESAKIVGFASLIYWVVKSSLQIPIGSYLDKNHGEKDDIFFMILGNFLVGLSPLGFLVSFKPWHIYFFHALQGIGMSMVIPSWSAIFTRHIDKGREAYEWSLRSTSLGFGAGIAGAVGGIIAATYGFEIIFILVAFFNMASALSLLLVYKEVVPRDHAFPKFPYSF